MWTGNNVTRSFRVAGAAALALLIDKVAVPCLTVVGLLILSRWGK
ncbi:hypothetical protein PRUPE_4G243200 [Prunus persica]|uniref:Uncharacterized protein n=1 Tax=Prunus persica TaxID=3760 RepID=A0A251PQ80_PRUPE|nr:hypothetical protein PRUPE_4G243200 [Prunus persica]